MVLAHHCPQLMRSLADAEPSRGVRMDEDGDQAEKLAAGPGMVDKKMDFKILTLLLEKVGLTLSSFDIKGAEESSTGSL
jgi:hypothetical protein